MIAKAETKGGRLQGREGNGGILKKLSCCGETGDRARGPNVDTEEMGRVRGRRGGSKFLRWKVGYENFKRIRWTSVVDRMIGNLLAVRAKMRR